MPVGDKGLAICALSLRWGFGFRILSSLRSLSDALMELRAGGLVVGADPFFATRSARLGELAARHAMPAVFENRSFTAAGGLASYGSNALDSYRLTGVYVARILKGETPADLPVQQGTKLELFINARAANALGITVPIPLSGRADEVIE
jgi:putative tryptophan/tyrosine transport system substrate-binding protein